MDYYFKPSALRNLKKLPKSIQKRIIKKLDFYINSKTPLKFAKSLSNNEFGEFRFRMGTYRILFDYDFNQKIIIVLAIGHRKDIYK